MLISALPVYTMHCEGLAGEVQQASLISLSVSSVGAGIVVLLVCFIVQCLVCLQCLVCIVF